MRLRLKKQYPIARVIRAVPIIDATTATASSIVDVPSFEASLVEIPLVEFEIVVVVIGNVISGDIILL